MSADFGFLAKKYCDLDLPLQVIRSNAGFFLGTQSADGEPVSRESMQYFLSEDSAEKALKTGNWTQRPRPDF